MSADKETLDEVLAYVRSVLHGQDLPKSKGGYAHKYGFLDVAFKVEQIIEDARGAAQ